MNTKRVLTIKEAAQLIEGLTEYRIRQMCISGQLPCFMAGKKYLISEEALMKAVFGHYEPEDGDAANIFERIRDSVSMAQVAELYGIDTRRSMINCIFHDDKTPSMKLYGDHYYCFGCGAYGDAVSFAAQVTGLSQYEAAKQLCSAFGIVHNSNEPFIKPMIQRETQREQETKVYRILSDYYRMLKRFREGYAPQNIETKPSPQFTESLAKLDEYENYCNIFISGTQEERRDFIENRKEAVEYARKRLSEYHRNDRRGQTVGTRPEWLDDKSINEVLFCEEFLYEHKLICVNDCFMGVNGVIDDRTIDNLIYEKLKPHIQKSVAGKVKQLEQALKLEAHSEEIVPDMNEIHLQNGTLNAKTDEFIHEKKFCFGRINNSYNPDASPPEKFLSFLSELLIPEDIMTLQEWFGYLLIPCTKAQKMLTMIGNGGEGKSRLGVLLKNIYGRTMSMGNLYTLETNRFARAALENAYLFLDDDMIMDKLSETNVLKTIITNEGEMLIEKKGIQPYSANIYAKLMSFGNGSLKSLTDKSDGFFRRQIIITTKPKPENRVDDPFLVEKFISEKEGILLWSLEGLRRLMNNDFRFTISDRTAENLRNSMKDSSNIIGFLEDEQFVKFGSSVECSTADLYSGYCHWCALNSTDPMKKDAFNQWLKQHHGKYDLEYCTNVQSHEDCKRARGYRGIDTTYRNNLR